MQLPRNSRMNQKEKIHIFIRNDLSSLYRNIFSYFTLFIINSRNLKSNDHSKSLDIRTVYFRSILIVACSIHHQDCDIAYFFARIHRFLLTLDTIDISCLVEPNFHANQNI